MKLKMFDGIALVFSLAVFLLFFLYGRSLSKDEGYLLIQDSEGESLYSMAETRDVVIEGPAGKSIIHIEGGRAAFTYGDCQDQLCVHMGDIQGSGEWAACLPNQVFITIEGGPEDEEGVDAGVY
jgi:hypothetical protein